MTRQEMSKAFETKLAEVGVPFHTLRVFGSQIHVECLGRDTASKWVSVLHRVTGNKTKCIETIWEAKENKGTSLLKSMVKGYRVYGTI